MKRDFKSSYNWQEKQNQIKDSYCPGKIKKSPGKTLISGMLYEIDLGKNFKNRDFDNLVEVFIDFDDSPLREEFDQVSKSITEVFSKCNRWMSYYQSAPGCAVLLNNCLGVFISNSYVNLKKQGVSEIVLKSDKIRSKKFLIKRARRIYVDSSKKLKDGDSVYAIIHLGNKKYVPDVYERMHDPLKFP